MIVLQGTSPSGDRIKVDIDGERVSLLMSSADGMKGSACDNRPPDGLNGEEQSQDGDGLSSLSPEAIAATAFPSAQDMFAQLCAMYGRTRIGPTSGPEAD